MRAVLGERRTRGIPEPRAPRHRQVPQFWDAAEEHDKASVGDGGADVGMAIEGEILDVERMTRECVQGPVVDEAVRARAVLARFQHRVHRSSRGCTDRYSAIVG